MVMLPSALALSSTTPERPGPARKVDGGVVGEGVVRGGGGQLLQGALLPGEEMGQGGQVLGALFLGGQVLVHREHLDHAVAVKSVAVISP